MSDKYALDRFDKKIILSLLNNSRAPVSVIAKETRLSREIVLYRMARLEEEQIITGYIARINQPLFCTGVALMMCKLIRSNVVRHKEIISFIIAHPSINWCIEICGSYDLALTILYNSPKDLADTITELSNHIGQNLREHVISLYIDEYKFDRSGLITEKAATYSKQKIVSFDKNNLLESDISDIQILSILAKNCRTKIIDMAKELKINEDTVRLRIKNLEKKGIITGYTISIDADKLGYEAYQMSMTIENMIDVVINRLKYHVQTNPYIVFCARTSGKHNITMNIHAKDRRHFNNIILGIRNAIPEIIDYEFQLDMKTHKEVFVPQELLKNKKE